MKSPRFDRRILKILFVFLNCMLLLATLCSGRVQQSTRSWFFSRKPIDPWPFEIHNPTRIHVLPGLTNSIQKGVKIISCMYLSLYCEMRRLKDDPNNLIIQDIGDQITKVASKEFGIAPEWEFCLFKDDKVNAVAFPTGKIAIFSGLVNYLVEEEQKGHFTDPEAILAFIMAHEVGHILAQHHKVKTGLVFTGGVLNTLVLRPLTQKLYRSMVGKGKLLALAFSSEAKVLGSELAFAKISRNMEFEADRIGLYLCMKAGFDPTHGLEFFERRARKTGQGKLRNSTVAVSAFFTRLFIEPFKKFLNLFNTHPRNKDRIKSGKIVVSSITDQMTKTARFKIWRNKWIQKHKQSDCHLTNIAQNNSILNLSNVLMLVTLLLKGHNSRQQFEESTLFSLLLKQQYSRKHDISDESIVS